MTEAIATAVTAAGLAPDDEDAITDERPGVAIAGLPASLIASVLSDQLQMGSSGYSQTDYLSPILSAALLAREKHGDDPEALATVAESVGGILDAVAREIGRDWGVDLFQLGLDPESDGYSQDVQELYRFSVCGRVAYARESIFQTIVADRRRILGRFRKGVDKKNQTVSEARRFFREFDDVVVWFVMDDVLREMSSSEDWSFDLATVLARSGFEPASTGFLASAARSYTAEGFATRFSAPILTGRDGYKTTLLELKSRFLREAPKKDESE